MHVAISVFWFHDNHRQDVVTGSIHAGSKSHWLPTVSDSTRYITGAFSRVNQLGGFDLKLFTVYSKPHRRSFLDFIGEFLFNMFRKYCLFSMWWTWTNSTRWAIKYGGARNLEVHWRLSNTQIATVNSRYCLFYIPLVILASDLSTFVGILKNQIMLIMMMMIMDDDDDDDDGRWWWWC